MALVENDLPLLGIEITSIVSPNGSHSSLNGLMEEKAKLGELVHGVCVHFRYLSSSSTASRPLAVHVWTPTPTPNTEKIFIKPRESISDRCFLETNATNIRLNKFVRRLHDMLAKERGRGVVEWRRGLLILHSINNVFTDEILPKYFNARNYKTFRRQLNYYGASILMETIKVCALMVRRMLFVRCPLTVCSAIDPFVDIYKTQASFTCELCAHLARRPLRFGSISI
jgi:hypothetical protein